MAVHPPEVLVALLADDLRVELRSMTREQIEGLHTLRPAAIGPDDYWTQFALAPPCFARLPMASVLVALRTLFGDSPITPDEFKSGFCHMLRVTTRKAGIPAEYLIAVADQKGSLHMDLSRLGPGPHPRPQGSCAYHDFVEEEFSREDYRDLFSWLYGYLRGFLSTASLEVPDFVVPIWGEGQVYGYRGNRPFARQYEDPAEFERALERMGVPKETIPCLE